MKPKQTPTIKEHLSHYRRVFWITKQIEANLFPNATTIAQHFEVSTKTASRTIDFMNDTLRLPLAYSAEKRGWYYTEPTYGIPGIELTEGELVGIFLAEQLLSQYQGTAIGSQVTSAFAKILDRMTNTVSINLATLTEAYSFEAAITSELDAKLLQAFEQAIRKRLRVKMTYFTATTGVLTKERHVDPLHLRNHTGEWYLIAFDHKSHEVRDFHAGRIREFKVTEEHFELPAGFDLESYLKRGFSMIRGANPIDVEMIFDEYQSRWIRERTPLHVTEQREELPDGRLRIKLQVTALDGIKRFVMQYGAHVKVIAPVELQEAIRLEIKQIEALYT